MSDAVDNRVFVLVLQHPQERREALSTAPLLGATLRRAKIAVGLSWPGLPRALGAPAEPRRWAVLHLGAARAEIAGPRPELTLLGRHGEPVAESEPILAGLHGIVLLDGTWSQAKTLWWRNPWLLKLHRIVLDPARPARLGRVRREPRREALSTLEAAALTLRCLEGNPAAADALLAQLEAKIEAIDIRPGRRR
ncbi:MAG: DTW domain-containing protein [Alphaproteobacteria bacterium]|nr:DTW domain-containing protein [Alphaproteobacteria bacterium]MBV9554480.1 DTW domain-containing protein [Alphaproteobacteria bacterium]